MADPPVTQTQGGGEQIGGLLNGIVTQLNQSNQSMGRLIEAIKSVFPVSGTLPVANGGTGQAAVTLNGVLYGNGTLALGATAQGASGSVLVGNGGIPSFSTTPTIGSLTLNAGSFTAVAGTTAIAPIVFQAGTNLTSAAAGALEFDAVQYYATIDTTSGRGGVPVEQYFHLTAAGSTISTIANYFGATSNISLVAAGYYVIDIYCNFLKTTAGTVTWTFTNSAAPTGQNVDSEFSPIAGIVTGTPTATQLQGNIYNDASAALAIVSGTLADAVNHYAHFRIRLHNGAGTSLKIQATASAGTLTPGINSYWFCRRISPNNIGTFAA